MNELTRDGMIAEPVSRDQILKRERGRRKNKFPALQLTTSKQDWLLTSTLYHCSIIIAGTFNMPTSYQWWVREREANMNWSMVTCKGSTRLELPYVYWPRAGGLSAVTAIGTQLRDPINSGLAQRRMAVLNK